MQELERVCVGQIVIVCILGVNTVKASGNQIGCDLGWRVLSGAIVITPL